MPKSNKSEIKPKTALCILTEKIPLLEYKFTYTDSGSTVSAQVCFIHGVFKRNF